MKEAIKNRLEKLEQQAGDDDESIDLWVQYASPEGPVVFAGWKCNDVIIMRKPGESDDDLCSRAALEAPKAERNMARLFIAISDGCL